MTTALGELSNVLGSKAVHVLFVDDGGGDGILGNVLGNGELDEDTVNGRVIVQGLDLLEEFRLAYVFGVVVETAVNVGLRGRTSQLRAGGWQEKDMNSPPERP